MPTLHDHCRQMRNAVNVFNQLIWFEEHVVSEVESIEPAGYWHDSIL
jgi:hypothetical protein